MSGTYAPSGSNLPRWGWTGSSRAKPSRLSRRVFTRSNPLFSGDFLSSEAPCPNVTRLELSVETRLDSVDAEVFNSPAVVMFFEQEGRRRPARGRCAAYLILSVFWGLTCRGIRLQENTRQPSATSAPWSHFDPATAWFSGDSTTKPSPPGSCSGLGPSRYACHPRSVNGYIRQEARAWQPRQCTGKGASSRLPFPLH